MGPLFNADFGVGNPNDPNFGWTMRGAASIANGKAVECWSHVDELGMMQQLGVIPTPEPAAD